MKNDSLKKKYGIDIFSLVIIFVGRLSEQKNLELLINSYKLVENKIKSSILIIVGEGGE